MSAALVPAVELPTPRDSAPPARRVRLQRISFGCLFGGLAGLLIVAPWEAWSTGVPWYLSLGALLTGLTGTLATGGSLSWRALRRPWALGLALFAAMVAVSTLTSLNPETSSRILRKEFLVYASVFLGLTLGVNRLADLRRLIHVLAVSGLLACAASVGTYHFYLSGADEVTRLAWVRDNVVDHDEPERRESLRAQYPLEHHNKLGFFSALTAMTLVYLGTAANGRRWLWWLSAVIPLWCLMLTLNRGALVGMAAAVLIVATMTNWRMAAGLAAAGLLVVAAVLPSHVRRHYETIFEPATYREHWTSMQYRTRGWRSSWNMIRDRPLTGVGYSWMNFEEEYPRYAVADEVQIKPHAHNVWIEMTAETGIIGGVGFAVFQMGLFTATWRIWWPRRRTEPWLSFQISLQLMMLIVGLISFYFREQLGVILWAVLAMGVVTAGLPEYQRRLEA